MYKITIDHDVKNADVEFIRDGIVAHAKNIMVPRLDIIQRIRCMMSRCGTII